MTTTQEALRLAKVFIESLTGLHIDVKQEQDEILAAISEVLKQPAEQDWSLLEATQESLREHMAMVRELQAQLAKQPAEQEAYAWVSEDVCDGQFINGKKRRIWWECIEGIGIPFYTAPQREWVSLTDDEIESYEIMGGKSDGMLARAIEAKLKEKNK